MLSTVIIGAGPYGLSVAAHLRHQGIPFRIFGRPMDSWIAHMPKGMMLKSDGFASNIYDPNDEFTLERYCKTNGIEYASTGVPVRLETFCGYGLAFRSRMVPELEEKTVVSIDRLSDGFSLRLEDGEVFKARRVILAVGITHFEYVPENLARLDPEHLSHSARYSDPAMFKGRDVVVIGGGSSALDWAGLLQEAGANVQLIARRTELQFHSGPMDKPRSLWKEIRHPKSGLGPGLRSRFYADAPWAFHHLPESLRLEIVRRTLGPSGGWFIKDKVVGKMPLWLGYTPHHAEVQSGKVHVHVRSQDGTQKELVADHVIAATGYKTDIDRLTFLSPEIRSRLKTVNKTPILFPSFESSIPGLYFVGVAAANSFGPVMRFAFGAGFAARTVAQAVAKSLVRDPSPVSIASVATTSR